MRPRPRRCGGIGGSSRSLSQWVHLDTVIVLEKQLVNRTEGAQCRRRPSVGARQVILDPESGVAQAAKPADRAGRGSVESGNA